MISPERADDEQSGVADSAVPPDEFSTPDPAKLVLRDAFAENDRLLTEASRILRNSSAMLEEHQHLQEVSEESSRLALDQLLEKAHQSQRRYAATIEENAALRQAVERTQAQLHQSQTEAARHEARATAFDGELRGVSATREKLLADLGDLALLLEKRERELSSNGAELAELHTSLSRSQQQLAEMQDAHRESVSKYDDLFLKWQSALAENERLLGRVNQTTTETQTAVDGLENEVHRLNNALDSAHRELSLTSEALTAANQQLREQRDAYASREARYWELDFENGSLRQQNAALETRASEQLEQLVSVQSELERVQSERADMANRLQQQTPLLVSIQRKASLPPKSGGFLNSVLSLGARRKRAALLEAVRRALFDEDYYLSHSEDVRRAGVDPFQHYLEFGAAEGRNPNPLFDSTWYLSRSPDVLAAGENPLVHYYAFGEQEMRDPHPAFSLVSYKSQNSSATAIASNILASHLRQLDRDRSK